MGTGLRPLSCIPMNSGIRFVSVNQAVSQLLCLPNQAGLATLEPTEWYVLCSLIVLCAH